MIIKEILMELLPFILAMLIIPFPVGLVLACRSVTKSNNFYKFLTDKQYWAFAVFNSNYFESRQNGIPYKQFKADFWDKFKIPFSKAEKALLRLPDEARATIIYLLCNPTFVQENFTSSKFDYDTFLTLYEKWEKYLDSREKAEKPKLENL